MSHSVSHSARSLATFIVATFLLTIVVGSTPSAAGDPFGSTLLVGDAGAAQFTTGGGATPLATDRTVPNWHGSFTDPTNGVTYGYNMVGTADPRGGAAGTTRIPVDIIPLNIYFGANGGLNLDANDDLALTLASPMFQGYDYAAAGVSAGNTNVQYEDAVMRSQFNQVGKRNDYHLILDTPTVFPTVRIDVPVNQGQIVRRPRLIPEGRVNITWFSSRLQNLMGSLHLDPTHLPIFLTGNVFLYFGADINNCCVLGYHGANKASGSGSGSTGSNGNANVQTFIYAAYARPGTYNPTFSHFVTDIHGLGHEIAEWGDDPFVNNFVNPWITPTAPQYGCTAYLETGDPVVGIGFHLPKNPDTRPYSDGYWHPEDEVFLPWFAREDPNVTSQPLQKGTGGRYTFMGSLNPYAGFQQPATGCN